LVTGKTGREFVSNYFQAVLSHVGIMPSEEQPDNELTQKILEKAREAIANAARQVVTSAANASQRGQLERALEIALTSYPYKATAFAVRNMSLQEMLEDAATSSAGANEEGQEIAVVLEKMITKGTYQRLLSPDMRNIHPNSMRKAMKKVLGGKYFNMPSQLEGVSTVQLGAALNLYAIVVYLGMVAGNKLGILQFASYLELI
jgi:hypothetical protein